MSDVLTLARTARESLARGLGALQSDPRIPPHLAELAAPIAQAMGALHQIERSGGAEVAQGAQVALAHVQAALTQLQAQPAQHPAVLAAMEAVAGALGGVHALSRFAPVAPAAPMAPVAPPQGAPAPQARPFAPQPAAAAPYAPPYAAPPAAQPQYAPQYAPPPNQAQAAPPPAAARPYPAQPPVQQAPPMAAQAQAPAPRAPAGKGDGAIVAAELGAHSQTNFYKGLSGNDIIDHGGLFVSTYKLPKIGQAVRLKISMPGGYEFEANAIVRWCREQSDAGNDAPPGFGAQLVEITPEARQLVYRYVRNREPMFHDDL